LNVENIDQGLLVSCAVDGCSYNEIGTTDEAGRVVADGEFECMSCGSADYTTDFDLDDALEAEVLSELDAVMGLSKTERVLSLVETCIQPITKKAAI